MKVKRRKRIDQCAGKWAFSHSSAAAHAANNMRKQYRLEFAIYECPHCTFWHVGRVRRK